MICFGCVRTGEIICDPEDADLRCEVCGACRAPKVPKEKEDAT